MAHSSTSLSADLVPFERTRSHLLVLRGVRVICDPDLAALYRVTIEPLREHRAIHTAKGDR